MRFPPLLMFGIMFTALHMLPATCLLATADRLKQQQQQHLTECGARAARREPRHRQPKIIAGEPTHEGQFPWQASLELLHPSMGYLGHWCGAVLIHRYWVLSAAHCVHNDLFNLPLAPLWSVVLGEHERNVESGFEQRIAVEKIVLHKRYQNFLHDLVLMKLALPADVSSDSNIRRICLPFVYNEAGSDHDEHEAVEDMDEHLPHFEDLDALPEKADNFLRSVQHMRPRQRNMTLPSMRELMSSKILRRLQQQRKYQQEQQKAGQQSQHLLPQQRDSRHLRRRNDKFMRVQTSAQAAEYADLLEPQPQRQNAAQHYRELPYSECIATGWGKANVSGDLTDALLKTSVPLHNNGRCKDAYGSFVKIHRGHLCAGKLNGKGGTCVGDSGGPLQCRLSKSSPWILAGITSFGSGCAIKGFPDVYTRTSYYMKWIQETIAYE